MLSIGRLLFSTVLAHRYPSNDLRHLCEYDECIFKAVALPPFYEFTSRDGSRSALSAAPSSIDGGIRTEDIFNPPVENHAHAHHRQPPVPTPALLLNAVKMLRTRSFKPTALRLFLTTALFLFPPLYLQTSPETWRSALHTSLARPSTQELLVTGLSHSSPFPTTRAALCITGHLRSFSRPGIRESIHRHVLAPLRDAHVLTDVFFHIGLHDTPRPGRARAKQSARSIEHALREFQPVKVSYFPNRPLPVPPYTQCSNTRRAVVNAFPPALLRTEQCLDLVARYEKEMQISYDWVYKTRPDVAFGDNISVPASLRKDTLYMNQHNPGTSVHAHPWLRQLFKSNSSVLSVPVADHVIVASRSIAEVAFRAKQAFAECALYGLPAGTLNSEVGLTYWLVRNRIRYEALPWFWMLVRDVEGPECNRVQWIRGASGRHDPSLQQRCVNFKDTGRVT